MFGDESAEIAEGPELSCRPGRREDGALRSRRTPRRRSLELSHASARGEGTAARYRGRLAASSGLGEVLGVAGVDGNGQRALAEAISGQRRLTTARSATSAPRSARSASPAREARAALRDRRPPRRGDRRGPAGLAEPRAQADRSAALLARRTHPTRRRSNARPTRSSSASTSARPSIHARAGHALGRQHPEAPARARALVRRQGGGLPQADLRPGPEDDPRRARDHRGPARRTARRWSSRPTSTSCSRSPTGSPSSPRGRICRECRQRAGRRRAGRPADDRRRRRSASRRRRD